MSVHLPTPGSDIKIWGLPLNDSFHPLLGTDKLNIIYNSTSQPPKIGANSKFYVYKTLGSYLTPNVTTGNAVYPGNTTCSYLNADVIFEPSDVTFTFGSGGVPAKSNSTLYYIYCTGAEDTGTSSRGKGVYVINTTAPAYDGLKQGWYDSGTGYRCICQFFVDSGGNVNDAIPLPSNLIAKAYLTAAANNVTTAITDTITNKQVYIKARLIPNTTTTTTVNFKPYTGLTVGVRTRLTTETGTTISTAVNTSNNVIANTPAGSSETLYVDGKVYSLLNNLSGGTGYYARLTTLVDSTGMVRYTADVSLTANNYDQISFAASQNFAIKSLILVYSDL